MDEFAGCEYGDRSYQCTNIQPFDCYVERNRQICCDRCRIFREQMQTTGKPSLSSTVSYITFGGLSLKSQERKVKTRYVFFVRLSFPYVEIVLNIIIRI